MLINFSKLFDQQTSSMNKFVGRSLSIFRKHITALRCD